MYLWQDLLWLLLVLSAPSTRACKPCVNLDEFTFDKVTARFDTVLLKFDVPFPYHDQDKNFTQFVEYADKKEDLLIAEVGLKKDDEELAQRFHLTQEDLPELRLLVKDKQVAELTKSDEWSLDNLHKLIKDNTDTHVALPGCLEKFDRLAFGFVSSADKEKHLGEAEQEVEKVEVEEEKSAASAYVKYMKKIIDTGTTFVTRETQRLSKILKEGKIVDKKRQELTDKMNILKSFLLPKDEL